MDPKVIEEIAVDYKEVLRKAYEDWEYKDSVSYREFERVNLVPWLSSLRNLRSSQPDSYYHMYLGTFLPDPRKLIQYFHVNRTRLSNGSIDRKKYKELQTPIVYLLRKLGMNPFIKIKSREWVKISTTRTLLREDS